MTVNQYEMRFMDLARHAVWLVPTKIEMIRRFNDGLNYGLRYSLVWEAELDVRFHQVVEIVRRLEQAQWMVDKVCLVYLAFVRYVSADTSTVESIPVVRDFTNVFPADVPSIPPDRDVDFCVDLVPDTQPISISPHHMAPIELKEMKERLQELLAKGFIRSSVSPLYASIIFVRKKDGCDSDGWQIMFGLREIAEISDARCICTCDGLAAGARLQKRQLERRSGGRLGKAGIIDAGGELQMWRRRCA
nr:uncharacterized protein LOC117280399 [Nicotiana tomentosiformis]